MCQMLWSRGSIGGGMIGWVCMRVNSELCWNKGVTCADV